MLKNKHQNQHVEEFWLRFDDDTILELKSIIYII